MDGAGDGGRAWGEDTAQLTNVPVTPLSRVLNLDGSGHGGWGCGGVGGAGAGGRARGEDATQLTEVEVTPLSWVFNVDGSGHGGLGCGEVGGAEGEEPGERVLHS